MIYQPAQTIIETCLTNNLGGRKWDTREGNLKNLRIIPLIWRLLKMFFRYGNQEIYYHVCGDIGKDCYDCPMDAENVEYV
jgi:hypothetical protein